ncbi:hypothetical protein RADP37_05337 [Roseomonas mucosa]|uniref:Uncharacterized protein n=1 Tax=Roseomonas mucosa TaxID=207340 RepID=A0A4Y1N2H9_9PROT|nr:hypothetical protein RADP37_05337 [Roseomonas mucosa]
MSLLQSRGRAALIRSSGQSHQAISNSMAAPLPIEQKLPMIRRSTSVRSGKR